MKLTDGLFSVYFARSGWGRGPLRPRPRV